MERAQTDGFGLSRLGLALVLIAAAVVCGRCTDAPSDQGDAASNGAAGIDYWTCTCPMHPSVKMIRTCTMPR